MDNEIIGYLQRIESDVRDIRAHVIKNKPIKTKQEERDEQLFLHVLPLSYPSQMNFSSNEEIFLKLKDKLNVENSSHLSRILVKSGFKKAVRVINGKQKRGFYLRFL